ncbi:MAG: hypothetical protein LUE99_09495 [Bacteroides sp.]|nr:hypothetical protein [Bacteroides sp.]
MIKQCCILCFLALLLASCKQERKTQPIAGETAPLQSDVVIDECTPQTVENLAQLCKVWGFLKYYHPSFAEWKKGL